MNGMIPLFLTLTKMPYPTIAVTKLYESKENTPQQHHQTDEGPMQSAVSYLTLGHAERTQVKEFKQADLSLKR